jgi:molybdate transport system substrate-binding protein
MLYKFRAPIVAAGLVLIGALTIAAQDSRLTVLCSNGLRAVLTAAAPQFEQASGNRLAISYSVSSELKKRIEAGERFDVAIVTPQVVDALIAGGTIAATSRTAIARSAYAIAVRRGAPKPDLRTVESLKSALVSATSIAFAKEGAGGLYFTALVKRLGLVDQLAAKLRPTLTGTEVSEAVASGSAELGVQPISEILFVPGVDLAGSFPPPVQDYTIMIAGISTKSEHADAARALIAFLMSAAVQQVLERRGMERVP